MSALGVHASALTVSLHTIRLWPGSWQAAPLARRLLYPWVSVNDAPRDSGLSPSRNLETQMSAFRTTLAAFALCAFSTPAFAGLVSSALVADVYVPTDIDQVSIQFELRDAATGDVAWIVPAKLDYAGRGIWSASLDLGYADWRSNRDLSWCVVVDATESRDSVELDGMQLRVDADSETRAGDGSDIRGDVGELCVTGTGR